jgi:hypothetical protein
MGDINAVYREVRWEQDPLFRTQNEYIDRPQSSFYDVHAESQSVNVDRLLDQQANTVDVEFSNSSFNEDQDRSVHVRGTRADEELKRLRKTVSMHVILESQTGISRDLVHLHVHS